MDRDQAVRKINEYAGSGTAFIFAVNFAGTSAVVMTPEEAAANGILFRFGKWTNDPSFRLEKPSWSYFDPIPVEVETYRGSFEKVIRSLKQGDTYLLNLTFPTLLKTDATPEMIYRSASAPFILLFRNHFVVFSPESFIRISGNRIHSFPMKGTIDASLPNAAYLLLEDRKECYEHNTIVDLIRNDLSMIATEVRVDRFRYLEHIRTNRGELLQMSSEISGLLPDNHWNRLGDNLFRMLPAGSVSGAPKERTVAIIHEAEIYDRGFYTGICGYFDGKETLESAVMIRFIESSGGNLWYKSGGGITALSEADKEYRELNDKIYVPVI
jgi:para-aminobenzoate synthetase component I